MDDTLLIQVGEIVGIISSLLFIILLIEYGFTFVKLQRLQHRCEFLMSSNSKK